MALKRKESSSFSLYDDEDEEEGGEPPEKKVLEDKKEVGQEPLANLTPASTAVTVTVKRKLCGVLGARRGERADMQDAHYLCESFLPASPDIPVSSFFAIFDGHAGARAARYAEKHLPVELRKAILKCSPLTVATVEKSIKKIFIDTYKLIDEAFLREARRNKPVWKDGTTATTLLVLNDCIYSANIGDSKAIVCRYKEETKGHIAVELTLDHNPQNYLERNRIVKAGGSVQNGRVNGIIEVSRSIGDGQFKSHGVTCIPDIKKFTITENDRFILIACDGLWKSFTTEDAIEFVFNKLNEAKKMESLVDAGEKAEWHFVAEQLAAEAVRRQCGDNVSVLLVNIK